MWEAPGKAFRAGFNLEKMYRGCLPAAHFPIRRKCDSLIKIKAERTESAKWITRQCSGKRGVRKISFIGQILYVDRDLKLFYTIRDSSIKHDIGRYFQEIQVVSKAVAFICYAEAEC